MLKRTVWVTLITTVIGIQLAAVSVAGLRDEMLLGQDLVDPLSTEDTATVEGSVHFERRSTVVPFAVCESRECPKSQTYWSMVINSQGLKYELDEIFALGKEKAPESIEVSGLVIRPGSRVAVQGTVSYINNNYGIVSNVKTIAVIMDTRRAGKGLIREQDTETSRSIQGWTCFGKDKASGRRVYSQVWHEYDLGGAGSYHLQVVVGNDLDSTLLASISGLQPMLVRNKVSFRGMTKTLIAELVIDETDKVLLDFPAEIRLKQVVQESGARMPIEATVPMTCSRTRYF